MFSETMIPMSTIVPMAMAMPASDMMLASTPPTRIAPNASSTATGSVPATVRLLRMWSRNSRMTAAVIATSSHRAVVSVATVSSISPLRS